MKTPKTPFSYVVLRYMHDVLGREFVNVGVLLYSPQASFLAFRKLSSLERVKGMFPGLHSDSLREMLKFLESRTEEVRRKTLGGLLKHDALSAESIAKSILTTDDSALQWSAPGGGVTDTPERTLNELFERLVTRHQKAHHAVRREDADVWKPFEGEFRRRHVLDRFQEKVLAVGELRHRFEAAWQPRNDYLRLFQPLSFDLIDSSGIVEKAVKWGALMRQLRKVDPDFFIYFLVGQPQDPGHSRAFTQACDTLNEEDGKKQLVLEGQASIFAESVEKEIRATFRDN